MKTALLGTLCVGLLAATAAADPIVFTGTGDDAGLSGTADFSLSGNMLTIVLTNTSSGMPASVMDEADQLLTSISFDLPGTAFITGGMVTITSGSASVNFDNVVSQLGGGADVSVEWGFGNGGTTGLLPNFASSNTAGATPFQAVNGGHPNLDGPDVLDGPQGGLVADPAIEDLNGLGAIQKSVTIKLNLSETLADLGFLSNGVIIEFGSDAAFLRGGNGDGNGNGVPEPAGVALLALGLGVVAWRRRRA